MSDAREWNVWVPDMDWTTPEAGAARTCRFPRCGRPGVAILWRRQRGSLPMPWVYCNRHLYGRQIIDGIVHVRVRPDSPAAKRGYVGPVISKETV